jgi:Cys-tRNA(Pro)/Cys-tRNA(Cys) deacylase
MPKIPRTQAMRALDARKIPYQVHLFPDSIRDAVQVAAALGMQPSQVFKTLVLVQDEALHAHPLLIMVPANCEVDLRLFARAIGVKSVHMASHAQAEKLTGLKVGGISALALLHRPFIVYIDESAQDFDEILVSAGQRGVDLQLNVKDLITVTAAQLIAATRPKEN